MTRTKTVLTLAFILVFAAGAVVGMVPKRAGVWSHSSDGPHHGGSFLTAELGLNADQQKQMKEIWSVMPAMGREAGDRRREYQKHRDDELMALLTPEQKTQYEAIQKEYAAHMAEMQQQRQAAFQQAVEKTKAILTPAQAAKYDQFLKRRPEAGSSEGPGGPHGGPPWRDRHEGGPSTHRAD